MTNAQKVMEKVLGNMKQLTPSPLTAAALSGNLDSYLARETIKRLEGKETFTVGDIRKAHNDIFEGK